MWPSGGFARAICIVEIIQAERFLEARRIRLPHQRDHGAIHMTHVVPADDAGCVGKAVRMARVGRAQQQGGRIDGAPGDDHDVSRIRFQLGAGARMNRGYLSSRCAGFEAFDKAAGAQRDVAAVERRSHANHFGIGFGVQQARKAVAGSAFDAWTRLRPGFIEPQCERQRKRLLTRALEVFEKFRDNRLMRDRWMVVFGIARRLRRIAAALAVDLIQALGGEVVRRQIGIAYRPRRRQTILVLRLAEVAFAQPKQRRAVHLGIAADAVMGRRHECASAAVQPFFASLVAIADENSVRTPIFGFTRQIVAALQHQYAFPRGCQPPCRRRATGAAADDDDVIAAGLVH